MAQFSSLCGRKSISQCRCSLGYLSRSFFPLLEDESVVWKYQQCKECSNKEIVCPEDLAPRRLAPRGRQIVHSCRPRSLAFAFTGSKTAPSVFAAFPKHSKHGKLQRRGAHSSRLVSSCYLPIQRSVLGRLASPSPCPHFLADTGRGLHICDAEWIEWESDHSSQHAAFRARQHFKTILVS